MKKLATAFLVLTSFTLSAQTIFYYGEDSVTKQELMKAWEKNNTGARTEAAFREYIDLYITSRLKIKEAKERGYDTLPSMIADLSNLRQQVLPSFLQDRKAVDQLVEEAFQRSQKEIRLAHIFIGRPGSRGPVDPAMRKYAEQAMEELNKGAKFEDVARKYSSDPSAKINGGTIGWITVFTLPYELENLAYATPAGKVSSIHQSAAGFHIFKNLEERKARGRIQAAQILLAYPPDADAVQKKEIRMRADSIYTRLQKGDDFAKLATLLSNDVISAAANGQMQEFGTGQYDEIFENMAFGLEKNGAITKPFETTHGFHIVKRLNRIPAPSHKTDAVTESLQTRVENSDRMEVMRRNLVKEKTKNISITPLAYDQQLLWAFSDSLLNYQSSGRVIPITNETVLFKVGERAVTGLDWISFAQAFRYKSDGSGLKTYPQLMDEFREALAMDYYQNNLEYYNEDFARQLNEFKEGNLFFEIMQKEVWGPAQTDQAALENYFNANKARYHWKESADAVIFYAADPAIAKTFRDQLVKSPKNWNSIAASFSENIAADSSRFELAQIPNPGKKTLKPGTITALLVNATDQSTSFAYVLRLHTKKEARSFEEARGLVINDYQSALEKKWVNELKQKYPVRINQSVVDGLVRTRAFE